MDKNNNLYQEMLTLWLDSVREYYHGLAKKYTNPTFFWSENKLLKEENWKLFRKGKRNELWVSDRGRLKSVLIKKGTEVYLTPYRRGGHKAVYLSCGYKIAGEKKISFSLHRAIALLFIPNPENKPQVNHIDGNTLNNSYINLEWVTNDENAAHAKRLRELKLFCGEIGKRTTYSR